ncbi:hypothetical protein OS493_002871 [Desmophyllum pertusum]|uniref:PARP catalytic domain-containing protein n=1 Tax=Desmophyllum pertusum TaxID=174260 RepID=A0A9W9YG54_9CNID|nr:hypothetical protein OS493_002871 [Desmophyllum pertusum]
MTEEDVVRFYCHTVQLCALLVLGLKLDGLEEMPTDEHRHHRTLGDWIEILLENNCESVNSADNAILTKELLVSIGFDPQSPAIETILARSFATSAQHHIEACEWAQIFIKDEFKYNPLLSPAIANKFPLKSDSSNMWFPLSSIAEGERYEDINPVNIMNLATKESDTSRNIHSVLRGFQDERNIVLFHGTDHQSAKNILDRGIYLCAGRQKRDFSCGKGFYLTNSLDEALNWAKSTTAKPAIVTFQVNREYFMMLAN